MSVQYMREFYFSKIDPKSDGELINSLCSSCKGSKCNKCFNIGRVPFIFDVEGRQYAFPLYTIADKDSAHSILKSISPEYPIDDKTGKAKSLSKISEEEMAKYLGWLYIQALYSGIDVEKWTKQREEYE